MPYPLAKRYSHIKIGSVLNKDIIGHKNINFSINRITLRTLSHGGNVTSFSYLYRYFIENIFIIYVNFPPVQIHIATGRNHPHALHIPLISKKIASDSFYWIVFPCGTDITVGPSCILLIITTFASLSYVHSITTFRNNLIRMARVTFNECKIVKPNFLII